MAVIYAPNETMKSSLAKTFEAVRDKRPVEEKGGGCVSSYSIVDENNTNIPGESIMVINPFDENAYDIVEWSQLENVRYFYDFFKKHEREFEK